MDPVEEDRNESAPWVFVPGPFESVFDERSVLVRVGLPPTGYVLFKGSDFVTLISGVLWFLGNVLNFESLVGAGEELRTRSVLLGVKYCCSDVLTTTF